MHILHFIGQIVILSQRSQQVMHGLMPYIAWIKDVDASFVGSWRYLTLHWTNHYHVTGRVAVGRSGTLFFHRVVFFFFFFCV